MNFAWMIKVHGKDLYVTEDLRLLPKRDEHGRMQAVVETMVKASHRAKRKFGENWGDFAELVEAEWTEFVGFNGRKGGSRLTKKKRKQLRDIAHLPRKWKKRKLGRKSRRKPKKMGRPVRPLYWWRHGSYAVCHFFIGLANKAVRRIDPAIQRGDLRRGWTRGPVDGLTSKRPAVFVNSGGRWVQVL
jgi:hypothetical protein